MHKKTATTVLETIQARELGLSEVRAKLSEAISKLKKHQDFSSIQGKQLKEYWNREYPPAPFEELFTLKQVAELNIDTFFKKRSVVASKILGIIAAIDNAVKESPKGEIQEVTSKERDTKISDRSLRLIEIEYNSLINQCRSSIEILRLADEEPDLKRKKTALKAIMADLKKADRTLKALHQKVLKLT